MKNNANQAMVGRFSAVTCGNSANLHGRRLSVDNYTAL